MTTKKNLVKSMLMSTLTAGIFSFSFVFTACSDDDMLESAVLPPQTEQEYNGPLLEPYGLSFYDYVTDEDVTILNADTTQISVSKALADKMGIQSFVGHPMGIWDHPEHRAYLRRATSEKLEGDRYILKVTESSIAEVLSGTDKEYKLSTELYVNTDPVSTRTRAAENNTSEYAARYIDENNVIHPMAITYRRAGGDQSALTRNAAAEQGIYGTYLPEHLLGLQDDPATRGWWNNIWNGIKKGVNAIEKGIEKGVNAIASWFEDVAVGTAEWFKAQAKAMEQWLKENTHYDIGWDKHNTLINIDSQVDAKVPIQCGEDSKDTINVYVKAPVKFNLNYTLLLQADGSVVEKPRMKQFEASVDGRFNFEPEIRLGFDGKLELPEDKQKIDLVELDGITVVFNIGYVPFCVDFNPSLFLKFKAEVEGKATMGVKYEFDSWFKGGIEYKGGRVRGINKSTVTKNKIKFITPTAEFNASAGVGLMFGCEMIIDKLVGPELAVGPQLTADAGLTISPFEKDPVNFEASVDFGIKGEVGAKLKIWKWELAEWNAELDFGLNWNLFKYPKENSNGDKNAEDHSNDNEVQKNVEEINKQGLLCYAATINQDKTKALKATGGTQQAKGRDGYNGLFDTNSNTHWYVPSSYKQDGKCWYVDFQSGGIVKPLGFILTSGKDIKKYGGCNPKNWKLYGKKNKNDEWTVMYIADRATDGGVNSLPAENNFSKIYNISNPAEYQYFRLEITENWGDNALMLGGFAFAY